MTTVYVATTEGLATVAPDGTVDRHLADRGRVECVVAAGGRVFAGTFDSGLWRRPSANDPWERVGESLAAVTALAVHPRDPDLIWAGTEPSVVYRSTDGGDRWERAGRIDELPSSDRWSFPPRPDTHHVRTICSHPADRDRWYVGVEAGAFLRTEDGGDSWVDHVEGARRDPHAVATHPDRPDRVYVAAGDGYAESPDGGRTWSYPQAGLDHRYVWGLAVDPGDSDRVLVSAARGARAAHRSPGEAYLYRRTDDGTGENDEAGDDTGDRWERLDGVPTGEGALRAVLAAGGPGEFYACNDHGLYRSDDGGDSWDRLLAGSELPGEAPRGMAVAD